MPEMEPVNEEAAAEINKPSAYISARHRQDAVLQPVASAGSDWVAAICAIVALITYAVIVFMLFADFKVLGVA